MANKPLPKRPLIKGKPYYTKRRLITIFLLCVMLAVSVLTGFSSGLDSDSTIYRPDNDRIVMWQELPESGTPEDYDLLSNLKFSAQKLYTSTYFKGITQGDVIANVGMGIKYTQHVYNTRIVKDGTIFSEAISSSSLKSVADQRYIKGDNVLIRPSTSISGNNATFGDGVNKISLDDYFSAYGARANEISKYAIDETTILAVKDENATTADAKNSDDTENGEQTPTISFEVPSSLVADENGNYTFTLTLDPETSTKYYRNEVRTLASADQNPVFYSVSITITIASDFTPIRVKTVENYDIAIPVLGAMNCTATMVEEFSDYNDETRDIPDKEFFESHIDDDSINGDLPSSSLSPADYLASAFGCYIDGSKTLDLTADVTINGFDLDGLKLSIDIATMDVKAQLSKLFVQYSGDKVYLAVGDVKGYLAVDAFTDLLNDPSVNAVLGSINIPDIDIDGLLGGDILSTVFANCEMTTTDGITCIRLPFELTEGINIDASLYIIDDTLELKEITGTVNAFGIEVSLNAKPMNDYSFPTVDDSYNNFTPIADFVPAILNTAMSNTYGIDGNVTINDQTIGLNLYIDRENGLTIDGTVNIAGQDVNIKFVDNVAYVNVGNIAIKAPASELSDLIEVVSQFVELDTSSFDTISELLPTTIDEWLDVIKSFDVTENKLTLNAKIIGIPFSVEVEKANGKLSALKVIADVNLFGYKFNADVDLAVSTPQKHDVIPTGNYVNAKDIVDLVPYVMNFVNADELGLGLNGNISFNDTVISLDGKLALGFGEKFNIGANATINALGQDINLSFVDGVAYIAVGNIKLKLDINDVNDIISEVTPLLDALGITLPQIDVDGVIGELTKDLDINSLVDTIIGAIKSFTINDGVLMLSVATDDVTLDVTINTANNAITINGNLFGVSLDLATNLSTTAPTISTPQGYSDVAELLPVLSTVTDIIQNKELGLGLNGSVSFNDTVISLDGKLALGFGEKFNIGANATINALGQDINLSFVDGVAYIAVGNIKLKLDINDVNDIISEVTPLLDALGITLPDIDVDGVIGELTKDLDINSLVDTIIGAIKSFTINDGVLMLSVATDDVTLDVTINTANNAITINGNLFGVSLDLATNLSTTAPTITAPQGYSDIAELLPVLSTVTDIINERAISSNLSVKVNDFTVSGNIKIDCNDGLKLQLTIPELAYDEAKVSLKITVIEKTAYIELDGSVKLALQLTLDDWDSVYNTLGDYIPSDVAEVITTVVTALADDDLQSIIDRVIPTSGDTDIQTTIDNVLAMIKSLNVIDGAISAQINVNDVTVDLNAKTDLTKITVDTAINGTTIKASLTDLASGATVTLSDANFVTISDLLPTVNAILPLVDYSGFDVAFTLNAFGREFTGNALILIPNDERKLELSVSLFAVDVTLDIKYVNDELFVNLNDNIKVSCDLSENGIEKLLGDLQPILDELIPDSSKNELNEIIDAITAVIQNPKKLLSSTIAIARTDDGVSITVDLTKSGIDASVALGITNANSKLKSINVTAKAFGYDIDLSLNATTDANGKLTAVTATLGDDNISLSIANATTEAITVTGEYVPLTTITEYVAPVYELISSATNAKSLTVSLDALLRADTKNKSTGNYTQGTANEFSGSLTIALQPTLSLEAKILMFANTEYKEYLTVKYVDGVIYLQSGNVKLKFDTATDLDRIYDVIAPLIPGDYLKKELAKLLGKESGTSAFSELSLLVDRINEIANATTTEEIINLLFSDLGGLSSDSAIKTMLDMIAIKSTSDGNLSVALDVMGINLNVIPELARTEKAQTLNTIGVTTTLALGDTSIYVALAVNTIEFSNSEIIVNSPADATEYVSLAEFTDVLKSAIGTFTARDENGNITFEVSDFTFSLLVKEGMEGSTVVINNIDGKSLLKGKLEPTYSLDGNGNVIYDEDGEKVVEKYTVSFEAHMQILTNDGGNTGAINIELYLTKDGNACVDYYENKTGYGERFTIDYESVMQIVAAVIDIIGVDDDIAQKIVGDYRQTIDTTVFDSMDIVGLDSLKTLVESLVIAVDDLGEALNEFNAVIDKIEKAGSVDNLKAIIPELENDVNSIIAKLNGIIGMFDGSEDTDTTTKTVAQLYKQIVNGVAFRKTESDGITTLGADVNNNITVGTDGTASIDVAQKDSKLTSVSVSGLDVDYATVELNTAFASGCEISDVTIPDFTTFTSETSKNANDNNLSNIKHLLFDVMNTANLMEFEIGDRDSKTTDYIKLDILNGVIDVSFSYNVQVKIIDQGVGATPRYKTFAMVEFIFRDCSAAGATVIPNGTTRLYFYDNMIYVQGIKSWTKTLSWFTYKYTFTPILVSYTVDELGNMISTDINKFLDEFVFYLLPLSEDCNATAIYNKNIKSIIKDSISSSGEYNATPTLATVFKGYTYTDGLHQMTVGLEELTGNSDLNDVTIKINGKNDSDDNVLDNYISSLYAQINLVGDIIKIKLNGTLRNVTEYTDTDGVNKIKSSGMSPLYCQTFGSDGYDYLYNAVNDTATLKDNGGLPFDQILDHIVYNTSTHPWERIWQNA